MLRRWSRNLMLILLGTAALDALYLAWLWPDWSAIAASPIPASRFIEDYRERRADGEKLPRLRWTPVAPATLPEHLGRAVVLAEDSRFFQHGGVDWSAVLEATESNLERGGVTHGASTISQQTVKNLFLSRERSWLRKWHELLLTWALEQNVEKKRILGIYLNIVELGEGIYGMEAAARHYFESGAAELTVVQAAELAATLPSPVQHNPKTRTKAFLARRDRVLALLDRFSPELVKAPAPSTAPTPEVSAAE